MGLDETNALVRRALAGSEEARGELLERLRPRLVLWSASRMSAGLRARIEPEDVAQEVLVALHRDLDRFEARDASSFMRWLFTIAENRIRDLVDHFGARKRQPGEPLAWHQTSPSSAAGRSEEILRVRDALQRLTPEHRDVIRLRRLEELSYEDVAEAMGRTPLAVRVLYCRALKALRAALDDGRNTPPGTPLA